MLTKFKNNISIIFLTISLIVFSYVIFRAEFIHEGQKLIFYTKYYIISIILIFFSVLSFFINKKIKYKIAILFSFFFILLYSIEIILLGNLALIEFKRNIHLENYAKKKNYNVDEDQPFKKNKFNAYRVLKEKYKNLALAIDPYHFLKVPKQTIMPLSSLSNVKTLQCNQLGYSNIYQTDRFGFNNQDMNWDKNFIDFFILGSRYAQGDCVHQSKNIAGNINSLTGLTAINVGYGGSGPLMNYAILREYLPISKTKRVVWLYSESSDLSGVKNIEGLTEELKNDILNNYLLDLDFSQNLIMRQNEIDEIVYSKMNKMTLSVDMALKQNKLFKFLKFSRIRNEILKIYNSINEKNLATLQILSPEFKDILIKSKEFAEVNNARFYFVYLTENHRYKNEKFNKKKHDYENLINFIERYNINLINIHKELFENHDNPLSLFAPNIKKNETTHYNEEGYTLVSETILKKINDFEKLN
tara:strand:+ start:491 stop:1909 length:1419 start_codon:yes stop_codon:yes gene_type:complete